MNKNTRSESPINTPKLIIGCHYRAKWQKKSGAYFALSKLSDDGKKAYLTTKKTRRSNQRGFWTNVSDLTFVQTKNNKERATLLKKRLIKPSDSVRRYKEMKKREYYESKFIQNTND